MIFSSHNASRRMFIGTAALALAAPALLRKGVRPAAAEGAFLGVYDVPFRRFKLGGFEITVLSDGGAMVDGPWPIVGEDRPKEDVAQLMRENLLPEARFRPGFSPTVINTGKEMILIDTGNGANGFIPRPAAGLLRESLAAAGIRPEQIDIVALTHCHVDHIGGVMEAGVPVFSNARYAVGQKEYDFWSKDERLSGPADQNEYKSARMFRDVMLPLAERCTFLKPGQAVAGGVTAYDTPGHTPGHIGFHIESDGKRLFAWGDCAHHEVASLAHPEWSAFFDMDKAQGAETRRKVYEMAATERLPILGYHTSFPSLGMIERKDTAYRWLPVTYQFED